VWNDHNYYSENRRVFNSSTINSRQRRHIYLIRWVIFASLIALKRISKLILAQVRTLEECTYRRYQRFESCLSETSQKRQRMSIAVRERERERERKRDDAKRVWRVYHDEISGELNTQV